MDGSSNLIDLSSPENNSKPIVSISAPLIPCPVSTQPLINSNPFDAISEQIDTDDPFEIIFKKAQCSSMVEKKKVAQGAKQERRHRVREDKSKTSKNTSPNNKGERKQVNGVANVENGNSCKGTESECSSGVVHEVSGKNVLSDPVKLDLLCADFEELQQLECRLSSSKSALNTTLKCSIVSSSIQPNVNDAHSLDKDVSVNLSSSECKKSHSTCSSDYVAKQIDKSEPCDFGSSQTKVNNRKCFSVPSFKELHKNSEDLCKESPPKDMFTSELSPVMKCGVLLQRPSSSSVISAEDSSSMLNRALMYSTGFSTPMKKETPVSARTCEYDDDVFIEAKKLAFSFSDEQAFNKLNQSEEDLFMINPKWDPVDSSDEENDLLRNDPTLNFKFVSPKKTPQKSIEFSEAVKNYKRRRSTDADLTTSVRSEENLSILPPHEQQLRRSASFCNSETPTSTRTNFRIKSTAVSAGLGLLKKQSGVPVNEDEFSVKLKAKKSEVESCPQKAVPLKATIPIQYMTRPSSVKGVGTDKRTDTVKGTGRKSSRIHGTPASNQKQFASPKPVASSTPNKSRSTNLSPAVSPIVSQNRLHSSLDSLQSANNSLLAKAQVKPARSNSLSSIPSPQQSLNDNKENIQNYCNNSNIQQKSTSLQFPKHTVNGTPVGKIALLSKQLNNRKLSNLPRSFPNVVMNARSQMVATSIKKFGGVCNQREGKNATSIT